MIPLASKMQPFTLTFSVNEGGFPVLHIFFWLLASILLIVLIIILLRNSGKIPQEVCDRIEGVQLYPDGDITVFWYVSAVQWNICTSTARDVPFCRFCPASGRVHTEWSRVITRNLLGLQDRIVLPF